MAGRRRVPRPAGGDESNSRSELDRDGDSSGTEARRTVGPRRRRVLLHPAPGGDGGTPRLGLHFVREYPSGRVADVWRWPRHHRRGAPRIVEARRIRHQGPADRRGSAASCWSLAGRLERTRVARRRSRRHGDGPHLATGHRHDPARHRRGIGYGTGPGHGHRR